MTVRKKHRIAHNLDHAIELCEEAALAQKPSRPRKVMEELMAVHRSTYGRWTTDAEMPVNRIRQFETLCGVTYVSDWLAMADGTRIVIDIPSGRDTSPRDVQQLQGLLNEAVGQIIKIADGKTTPDNALAAIRAGMAGLAWHEVNLKKHTQPELEFAE